jgi:hypothetical protein
VAIVRRVTRISWEKFKADARMYACHVFHYGRPYIIEGHGVLVPRPRAQELCEVLGMDFEDLRSRSQDVNGNLDAAWDAVQHEGFAVLSEPPRYHETGDFCAWLTDNMAVTMMQEGNPDWSAGFDWGPELEALVAASLAV